MDGQPGFTKAIELSALFQPSDRFKNAVAPLLRSNLSMDVRTRVLKGMRLRSSARRTVEARHFELPDDDRSMDAGAASLEEARRMVRNYADTAIRLAYDAPTQVGMTTDEEGRTSFRFGVKVEPSQGVVLATDEVVRRITYPHIADVAGGIMSPDRLVLELPGRALIAKDHLQSVMGSLILGGSTAIALGRIEARTVMVPTEEADVA